LHEALEVGTKVYIGHERSPLIPTIGYAARTSIDVLNRHLWRLAHQFDSDAPCWGRAPRSGVPEVNP
jgi:hypothetical protein